MIDKMNSMKGIKVMRKNKICLSLLICIILIITVTSCKKDEGASKILKESSDNFMKADSLKTSIDVDTLFETVSDATGVKMFFELENTTNPVAGHAVGKSVFEFSGMKNSGEVEVYQLEEDGEMVTYSRINDMWIKETGINYNDSYGIKSEFIKPEKKPGKILLKKETTKVNDKECYELTGYMTGKDAENIFDISVINQLSGIDTPDTEDIARSTIPFVINIYKDSMLPAKIYIDMTDALDGVYEKMDENTSVSKFTITIKYGDYNNVKDIIVPEEVKQAAQ